MIHHISYHPQNKTIFQAKNPANILVSSSLSALVWSLSIPTRPWKSRLVKATNFVVGLANALATGDPSSTQGKAEDLSCRVVRCGEFMGIWQGMFVIFYRETPNFPNWGCKNSCFKIFWWTNRQHMSRTKITVRFGQQFWFTKTGHFGPGSDRTLSVWSSHHRYPNRSPHRVSQSSTRRACRLEPPSSSQQRCNPNSACCEWTVRQAIQSRQTTHRATHHSLAPKEVSLAKDFQ